MSKRPSTADRDRSVTEDGDGDAFLSRWARRKGVARGGGDPDDATADVPMEEERAGAPVADESAGEGEDGRLAEPGDEDMPPLESIDEDTDMSGFFSPKVSQAVKKAALRKFFHSPVFNIVDGLDDYDDDFRNFAALGDIVTADMRGQMEHEAEQAREKLAKDAGAGPQPDAEAPPVEVAGEAGEPVEEQDEGEGEAAPEQVLPAADGVTREPGRQASSAGHGKLRPRRDGGEDA